MKLKLGGLFQLGNFAQWELTAAQRALLLGPDKSNGGSIGKVNGKPAKRLTMEQMREMTQRSNEKAGVV